MMTTGITGNTKQRSKKESHLTTIFSVIHTIHYGTVSTQGLDDRSICCVINLKQEKKNTWSWQSHVRPYKYCFRHGAFHWGSKECRVKLWVRCVSTGNGQTSWCSSDENSEMVLWSLVMNDCRIHAAHRTATLDYFLGICRLYVFHLDQSKQESLTRTRFPAAITTWLPSGLNVIS